MPLRITFDPTQIERFAEALDRAPDVLNAELNTASILSTAELEAAIKELLLAPHGAKPPAVAYGTLVNAVFGEPHTGPVWGGTVAVHPPADVYAAPVETGSRPHFPPVDALLGWVRKKFGITDEQQARSLAFVIARSIARKGTRGHQAFQRGVEKAQQDVMRHFEHAVDRTWESLQ